MYDDWWEDSVNLFPVEATTDTIGGKEDDVRSQQQRQFCAQFFNSYQVEESTELPPGSCLEDDCVVSLELQGVAETQDCNNKPEDKLTSHQLPTDDDRPKKKQRAVVEEEEEVEDEEESFNLMLRYSGRDAEGNLLDNCSGCKKGFPRCMKDDNTTPYKICPTCRDKNTKRYVFFGRG